MTTSRADYGLQRGLIRALLARPGLEVDLLVSGSHLEAEFGYTVREIEADGLPIAARLPLGASGRDGVAAADTLAHATRQFARRFRARPPDLAFVLGDRFELLGVGSAALLTGTPLAHLHGGERTDGAIDDAVRHALTKLAQLHFVAAEPYRRRVIQLGESPERVFVVGAIGLDRSRVPKADGSRRPGRRHVLAGRPYVLAGRRYVLATLHPVTVAPEEGPRALEAMLDAFEARPDVDVVFTAPGADPGSRELRARVEAWVGRHAARAEFVVSLGRDRYLALLAGAAAVLGNSSSGILEAPAFGVPTVNVGTRQAGRLRARSIVDAEATPASVRAALDQALDRPLLDPDPPYGSGDAIRRILSVLARLRPGELRSKRFHDVADPSSTGDASRRPASGGTADVVA